MELNSFYVLSTSTTWEEESIIKNGELHAEGIKQNILDAIDKNDISNSNVKTTEQTLSNMENLSPEINCKTAKPQTDFIPSRNTYGNRYLMFEDTTAFIPTSWNVYGTHSSMFEEISTSIYHKCEICKKWFTRKSEIKYHQLLIHADKQPFNHSCDNCKFTKMHSEEKHLENHMDIAKRHFCNICNESFDLKS